MAMQVLGGLLPQTSISLGRDAVDVVELSALLASTRQNCMQFPLLQTDGSLAQVAHPSKLRLALLHSTLVVSIHMRGPIPGGDYMHRKEQEVKQEEGTPFLNWCLGRRLSPPRLIAFGRATSDHTLTASIHDLVVAPSLQRRGFGRQVLQRLLRELGRRGITDIAALASPEQRPFFAACGFADDELNSTTMLYLRSSRVSDNKDSVKQFGRKTLLVPAALKSVYKLAVEHHDMDRS